MEKEFDIRKDPIIFITAPKITTVSSTDCIVADQYDYSESHVIYKGDDLGSFEELVVMKKEAKENIKLRSAVKYYVDILTGLKKWLGEDEETLMVSFNDVLNKIKELEVKNNG